MEIKFIGTGSGFSRTNTNAFFEYNNELILIDCSMLNMNRIKDLFDLKKYKSINVFITHMHGDHVSGLPNFIQFLYHKLNIVCNVMIPSSLRKDLVTLNKICGVGTDRYKLIVLNKKTKLPYLIDTIRTEHTESLPHGSYGFVFKINNKICVYTGDTKSLDAFKKYVDICDEIYIDTAYGEKSVHVSWDDLKNNLPKCKKIYLMHLNDEEKLIEEAKKYSNVEVVKPFEK